MTARLLVLASGTGSLLQAVLDSPLARHVVAVGSDNPEAGALERAAEVGIEAFCVIPSEFPSRRHWDQALQRAIGAYAPTLVISAGFMRILGPELVQEYRNRIINTHPALLPAFPGAHAVPDALRYGVKVTGCTVHFVDEGVDTGTIIAQEALAIEPNETEEHLHERIKVVERAMLVDVVTSLIGEQP